MLSRLQAGFSNKDSGKTKLQNDPNEAIVSVAEIERTHAYINMYIYTQYVFHYVDIYIFIYIYIYIYIYQTYNRKMCIRIYIYIYTYMSIHRVFVLLSIIHRVPFHGHSKWSDAHWALPNTCKRVVRGPWTWICKRGTSHVRDKDMTEL